MPQEELNKLLKKKLEQLKAVPEVVEFDPSVAWFKLEERLHQKNKPFKITRYVVVACVVVILLSVWVIVEDNKVVSKKLISHKVTSPSIQITSNTTLKPEGVSEASLKPKPIHIASAKNESGNFYLATTYNTTMQSNTSALPTLKDSIPLVIRSEPIVAAPPVKKFRIVHNNEIAQRIEMAKRNTTASTSFQFFKQSRQLANDVAEPLQVAEDEIQRKDRGFIKAITNALKEN